MTLLIKRAFFWFLLLGIIVGGVGGFASAVFMEEFIHQAPVNPAKPKEMPGEAQLSNSSLDSEWAKNVKNGGYILHFRHAQRLKGTGVVGFDAYELKAKVDAEKSSFKDITCLTPIGIEEAKLMGHIFALQKIKIDKVISSPSCRAIQTARYSFGNTYTVDNSLLHRTAIAPDQWVAFSSRLKKLMIQLKPEQGKNIILVGHGATLQYSKSFIIGLPDDVDDREETGFVIMENINGELFFRYKFKHFRQFITASLELPLED